MNAVVICSGSSCKDCWAACFPDFRPRFSAIAYQPLDLFLEETLSFPTDGAKLMMQFLVWVRSGVQEHIKSMRKRERNMDNMFVCGSVLLMKEPTSTGVSEHVHYTVK